MVNFNINKKYLNNFKNNSKKPKISGGENEKRKKQKMMKLIIISILIVLSVFYIPIGQSKVSVLGKDNKDGDVFCLISFNNEAKNIYSLGPVIFSQADSNLIGCLGLAIGSAGQDLWSVIGLELPAQQVKTYGPELASYRFSRSRFMVFHWFSYRLSGSRLIFCHWFICRLSGRDLWSVIGLAAGSGVKIMFCHWFSCRLSGSKLMVGSWPSYRLSK
jgi:hypothetical protein